ncbi:MAG: glycosyltransferase family 4 protein [Nannocystaceae bacterium]|nr:glycosyltransferase family 4 protein [Nannocystaceae bacterium]
MMHILYLHQYFVGPDGSGGTRSLEMARRWVQSGHRVTLITSSALFSAGPTDRARRTCVQGIDVVVLPVPYAAEMSHARRIQSFLSFAVQATRWAVRTSVDVVFASSTPLTVAVPGLLGAAAQRVPMVFEVRDAWPDLPIAMGALKNPVAIWAARILETAACRGASQVIALSPGMAQSVARCGVARGRIHVVPNACDTAAFEVDHKEARAFVRRSIPGDGPLVVYAGSFGAINDAAWLVDVAAASSGVRFAFVGQGPGREGLGGRARAHGLLDHRVFVRPPISKREVPLLLRGAAMATSLFLPIPAMEDNSANKFFDALAAGTPIAINYGGWQAELLRHSGAGIVMPHARVEVAALQLSRAVHDDAWRGRAGRAARHLARARFDRDRLAAQALSVVQRAAAG